jgi:hypothetical protein
MAERKWRVRLGAAAELDLFHFEVLQPDPTSRAQAVPRLFDSTQKSRVILETVFKPVLLRLKADQHARRFAVARNNDLLRLCLSKKLRPVVLDLGKWNFFHSGLANCASHDSASDLATIAKTSTVVPETS